MKRILIIAAAVLLTLTACTDNTPASTEAPAETAAPTEALYIDTPIDEPEWTLAEGELQLEDNDNVYAGSEDILYFAIVTSADGAQELRFRLNDETAEMLRTQSPDVSYYMTLNGEKIGAATLSEDGTVATVTAGNATEEITSLASKIRGLSE